MEPYRHVEIVEQCKMCQAHEQTRLEKEKIKERLGRQAWYVFSRIAVVTPWLYWWISTSYTHSRFNSSEDISGPWFLSYLVGWMVTAVFIPIVIFAKAGEIK